MRFNVFSIYERFSLFGKKLYHKAFRPKIKLINEESNHKIILEKSIFEEAYSIAIDKDEFIGVHFGKTANIYFCMTYMETWYIGHFNFKTIDDKQYIELHRANIKQCLHCNSIFWEDK